MEPNNLTVMVQPTTNISTLTSATNDPRTLFDDVYEITIADHVELSPEMIKKKCIIVNITNLSFESVFNLLKNILVFFEDGSEY